MILAFQSDAEREENLRLFVEATKWEIKETLKDVIQLNHSLTEIEAELAKIVREQHGAKA